jgi:hypothetical protein
MASIPSHPSPAARLSRMREMFDAHQAVLAEDYEHFTRPSRPMPDVPIRQNKAARKSVTPSAPPVQERS